MQRDLYDADHEAFRAVAREFVQREVVPHQQRWEAERFIDRDAWLAAGKQGLIGLPVPEEYGGPGAADFRYRCVLMEELARVGAASLSSGFGLQDDIALPYLIDLGTAEQKSRWLPPMVSGESIGAIAMTEPGAGSDLQGITTTAARDGEEWVVNGAKTFITNGIAADLVIVAARTDPAAGARGISLIVVQRGAPGFTRGRKLDKLGLHAQDTAELFFDDVRVPASNLLGSLGSGFVHLMERLPRERMSIAIQAGTSVRAAIDWTVAYTKERRAFGKPIAAFQNTQFELANAVTEVDVLEAYLDKATRALNAGTLSAVDAAKAKLWATEVQNRVIDHCLQLFGGYGFMMEYPIARAFADARVQTIYGGTSEIMRTIIGRDITGLR
ncbi:MAG TPA: acyl-CoA dehydrogenase family protein [Streptosporangiaceae bacterium]|nr:acyl-CoA dehydrogenase family protein [Streptosporangiaceae bacterium]